MNCDEVKTILRENLTATDQPTSMEIENHLSDCDDCRAYRDELIELAGHFAQLKDISLSDTEAVSLENNIMKSIRSADHGHYSYSRERVIYNVARLTFAAAATLIIMLVSFNNDSPTQPAINQSLDEIQLTKIDMDQLVPLLYNGDTDLLPSMMDQNSASYLTGQIKPGQAEDIFEGATADELEWLLQNFSMEI